MKVYKISHITDLLALPDDRLDVCLDELKVVLRAMHLTVTVSRSNGDQRPEKDMFPVLRWEDDDDPNVTITNNGKDLITIRTRDHAVTEREGYDVAYSGKQDQTNPYLQGTHHHNVWKQGHIRGMSQRRVDVGSDV